MVCAYLFKELPGDEENNCVKTLSSPLALTTGKLSPRSKVSVQGNGNRVQLQKRKSQIPQSDNRLLTSPSSLNRPQLSIPNAEENAQKDGSLKRHSSSPLELLGKIPKKTKLILTSPVSVGPSTKNDTPLRLDSGGKQSQRISPAYFSCPLLYVSRTYIISTNFHSISKVSPRNRRKLHTQRNWRNGKR